MTENNSKIRVSIMYSLLSVLIPNSCNTLDEFLSDTFFSMISPNCFPKNDVCSFFLPNNPNCFTLPFSIVMV
jgi:hypothetical protein